MLNELLSNVSMLLFTNAGVTYAASGDLKNIVIFSESSH